MDLLEHQVNPFNGIVIAPDALPADPATFGARLRLSVDHWTQRGHPLIWLEIPIHRAALVAEATAQGFTFHHTTEAALTLTYRIHPNALIPTYATHYIGAGGVVINAQRELLVVSERHRRDPSRPHWKLPGGALHPGEHLAEAVAREVLEETGVQAQFQALICFRHWHGYRWGKSDIYFVCRLTPISEEIVIQLDEIEQARWMPTDQYLADEHVSIFNKKIVRAALETPGIPTTWVEGYADPSRYEFFLPGQPS